VITSSIFHRPLLAVNASIEQDHWMPQTETPREIDYLPSRHLAGRVIRRFEVFDTNTLKTVQPKLELLVGAEVTAASCSDRVVVRIWTLACEVVLNLERTGRVEWIEDAGQGRGNASPTARVLLDDGGVLDLRERGRTKRTTVSLVAR
jgi:hypothetical protein